MFKSDRKVFNFNKKTLIISALLTFLCLPLNVNATESSYKPGYTVPLAIRQASLTSPTSFTKNAYGNIITDDPIMPAYIYALYNGGGYTYDTYGTFITICPNEGIIANHTYTFRFLVSTSPGSYSNNQYYKFGSAWNYPIKLVNGIGHNPTTNGIDVKNLVTNYIQYTDVLSQDFSYISEMTSTFIATASNTCISINIDMNGNFNNQILYFLGYILIDSGIDNSQQLDNIKDAIQGDDLTNDDVIDDAPLQDYQDKEDAIINSDALDKINDIEIAIDSNSNLFIWNLVDSLLNTHSLVFGMFIAILSVGLIKLILNR